MKTICLIRHATAEEHHPSGKDIDRRLTSGGTTEARQVGEFLSGKDLLPDLVIASPSRRTRETAVLISEVMGLPPKILTYLDAIYNASAATLLQMIRETNTAVGTLFLVAHNPGISDLGNLLDPSFTSGLGKGGLLALRFEISDWKEIADKKSKILFQFAPAN